ncbi:MAG TPA: type II secretion system secretin GspD, partial [Desulfosalsimonadaceae bacterium]|nr:type II secretion system secretin GspD [Desulfosalsimonadaceae bacterium]
MTVLHRMELCAIGAVCLVLLFTFGCAGGARHAGPEKSAARDFAQASEKPQPAEKKAAGSPGEEAAANSVSPADSAEKQGAEKQAGAESGDAQESGAAAGPDTESAPAAGEAEKSADSTEKARSPDAGNGPNRSAAADADKADTAQKPQSEQKQEKESLVLNFDNADLGEVIKTLADLLDINYLLEPGVGGSVTIHTSGELSRSDLFPVFYQILQANGLTAVKKDNLYRIVPSKEAARMPIAAKLGKDSTSAASGGEMMIQLIQLDSIAAQEMTKVIQPFVSSSGTIVTLENANILMVVDHAENMDKILRMVDSFDADIFEDVQYRFYPLEYADAETLSKTVEQLFKSYGKAVQSKINLIAITRLNTLLVVSPKKAVLNEVAAFVEKYDVPSKNTGTQIFVYSVKNGRAKEMADLLQTVFSGKAAETGAGREKTYRNPFSQEAKQARQEKEQKQREAESGSGESRPSGTGGSAKSGEVTIGSGSLRGEVTITPDEVRNNLIIEAAPADYQVIKNLLQETDILPRQVLIDVTIAEVTLDESLDLGVEWSYMKNENSMSSDLLEATIGENGLRYTVGSTAERWTAAMNALEDKNKVNIRSSPSILASNSEEASIDVSTEVPVASSQYEYTSNENPVVSTNVEYRDTGVLLNVTPHINKNGIVTMDISQEVSEIADNVEVGGQSYPSFFKRSAETILTVKSGQTIVIAGLIRENKSGGARGTPWLVDIPILKHL